jgi:hypothetical protein
MTRIVFRTIVIVMAVLGLIDPGFVASRRKPAPVRLKIIEPAGLDQPDRATTRRQRAGAVAKRLTDALGRSVDFSDRRDPAAVVLIGGAPPDALPSGAIPVSTVALSDAVSPNVRLVRLSEPPAVPLRHAAVIEPEFEAVGMNGKSSAIIVTDGGAVVARTVHRWTKDRERFRARLQYAPPSAGVRLVTVEAQGLDEEHVSDDNLADVALLADDRPLRVLAYEPRPSWNATFVRRALEADSRFRVDSIVRPSRGVLVRSGELRALAARALDDFDVAIVGAPEELREPELEALSTFARERGGGVVFLPDRRPSGPYVDLLPAGGFDEMVVDNPVRLAMDVPTDVRASELLVARRETPMAGALAAVERSGRMSPVALTWTHGVGRMILWGALDAWRYRADPAGGFARFWQATVADLALTAPPPLMVGVSPRVAAPYEPIVVRATMRPTEFIRRPDRLEFPPVGATLVSEAGATQPVRLWPTTEAGVFEGRSTAPAPGRYAVQVTAGSRSGRAPVIAVAATRRAFEEDAEALKLVAQSTGGVAVAADSLGPLEQHLRALAGASEPRQVHPMRSRWWVLTFAACLCAEWALRRRRGLR